MDNEKIINFLCKAKKVTYAGKGKESVSSRPNSHDLHYQEDDLLYIDSYLGGNKFSGEEAIWIDGVPYWSMNYIGRVIGKNFSGDFLKEVLSLVNGKYPYRGPLIYQSGKYNYHCIINGSFDWFNGNEEIFYNGEKIYECNFHGGKVE
jgi:hypothetical protein